MFRIWYYVCCSSSTPGLAAAEAWVLLVAVVRGCLLDANTMLRGDYDGHGRGCTWWAGSVWSDVVDDVRFLSMTK